MDDLEYNDLEYREERKESVQPIKKNIALKLKSTSNSNSSNNIQQTNKPLFGLNSPAIININNNNNTNGGIISSTTPNNNNNSSILNVQTSQAVSTNNNFSNTHQIPLINNDLKSNHNTPLGQPANKIPRLSIPAPSNDIDERLDEDFRVKNLTRKDSLNKAEKLNWNFKVNLAGTRLNDQTIFCCEVCFSPIFIYGRMIPCKHVFCIKCARESPDKCPKISCREAVERIEEAMHGHIFICTFGRSSPNSSFIENQIQTPSKITCGRSYMSARDLNAHIQHRHSLQSEDNNLNNNTNATSNNNTNQFTNNNPARANLITIMTKNEDQLQQHNKQNFHSLVHHQNTSFLNEQRNNMMQLNSQMPPLLPSPNVQSHHPPQQFSTSQFNPTQQPLLPTPQQQQQLTPQSLLPPLIDLQHQTKRPFDFNIKTPQINNIMPPPNTFNPQTNTMHNFY